MDFDHIFSKLDNLSTLSKELDTRITMIECQAIIQNGPRTGEKCRALCSKQTCPRHTLRVKKDGNYWRIVGTEVILNETYQAIGYKRMGKYHWMENESVRWACSEYDICFVSIIDTLDTVD